jgi:hypothetical protein
MQKGIRRKGFVYGIIILLVGLSLTPGIMGNKNENNTEMFPKPTSHLAEDTITDWAEDVCSIDPYTGNISIVTEHLYVEVDNLDVISAFCTQEDGQVTVNLQVTGIIEDRGGWPDSYNFTGLLDLVEYDFQVTTSEQEYWISYINKTGSLEYENETINLTSSNFSVDGDTLSMTFSLINAEEIYQDFSVYTTYIRINLSDPYVDDFTFLYDMAPNPPLTKAIFIGIIHNVTTRQDYIIFKPIYTKAIRFMPFNISTASNDQLLISKQHIGYIGHWAIIGVFNVADYFLLSTISYSHYQRIINTYFHHSPSYLHKGKFSLIRIGVDNHMKTISKLEQLVEAYGFEWDEFRDSLDEMDR